MAGYGDKPFGLNDIKITNLAGSTQEDLPVSRTLSVTERIRSGELSGDDSLVAVVAILEALEWSLEAGGISLEAYELLTGRTAVVAGSTPNETVTLTSSAGDVFPYFKIYGKSVGDGNDDVHCLIFKAKCTSLEGSFAEGEFFITSCSGIAVDDGTNGIYDLVQNETAAALPGS